MSGPGATRADVFAALAQKVGFEVVSEKETKSQLRIIGRCSPKSWPFLLPVIFVLEKKAKMDGSTWTVDISKKYLESNDRVLYSWRFIFQSQDVVAAYPVIVSTIKGAPLPGRVEVDEVLLPGYKIGDTHGGVNEKGKGSASAGTAPLAVTRRR